MAVTPDARRVAAAHFDQAAGWLVTALDRVLAGAGPQVWQGPAADRFSDEVRWHRERLKSSADELRLLARRLCLQADESERQSRQLGELVLQRLSRGTP